MINDKECCPQFNPLPWDGKTHEWKDKLFLKDEVKQILHVPLNMGKVVTRMWKKIQTAKAAPKNEEFLMLCYDPSPWKSELYMTVTKNVSDGDMTALTGTFESKVFDGPYQDVPKWIQQMDEILAKKKQKALRYYFHFAYCPKCAKKYNHNYGIAFAQVK